VYEEVLKELSIVENISTVKQVKELSKKTEIEKLGKLVDNLKNIFGKYLEEFNELESKLNTEVYQQMNIKEKGGLISLMDKLNLHGGFSLFSNKFDELKKAISNYKASYNKILKYFEQASIVKKESTEKIQQTQEQTPKDQITEPAPKQEAEESEFERGLKELSSP
jgi:hypothetical protein